MMFFFLTIIFKREKEMERDGELLGRLLSFPFSFFLEAICHLADT